MMMQSAVLYGRHHPDAPQAEAIMKAADVIQVELGADEWNPSGWIASGAVGVVGFAIGCDFYFQEEGYP